MSREEVEAQKPSSWWYSKASGGGSLLDYLGYGTTLGTWFMGGEVPIEVTSVVDETPASRSTSIRSPSAATATGCRNSRPAGARSPIRGRSSRSRNAGSSWSAPTAASPATTTTTSSTLQTRQAPAPARVERAAPAGRPARSDRISAGPDRGWRSDRGPLDPSVSLIGQRIIDSAVLSAASKRTVALVP